MEMIFGNTEDTKTNEPNKFRYYFNDNLNVQEPNKNIVLVNLFSIYYT